MPPRGVRPGSQRDRQYEQIKQSERGRGVPEARAEEIAARTVNKSRARAGETQSSARLSLEDLSSARRGGLRSGTDRAKGRTYRQLYEEARGLLISGRSGMRKAELERAVEQRKSGRAGR